MNSEWRIEQTHSEWFRWVAFNAPEATEPVLVKVVEPRDPHALETGKVVRKGMVHS